MANKILVIDDEEIVTKSLQKLLKKQGYEVTVTQNAADALEEIKKQDFDLIVSDVRMPQMDGIEIVKKIREYLKERNKGLIPEILITGYTDEEKYKSAVSLKVADYIFKPFDTAEFLNAIRKNLDAVKR